MAFFDSAVAAQLQYVTLPLEVVGLGLAAIEIRMTDVSARLVAWINAMEARLDAAEEARRAAERSPVQRFFDRHASVRSGIGTGVTRLTTLVTFALVLLYSGAALGVGFGLIEPELGRLLVEDFTEVAFYGLSLLVLPPMGLYLMLRFAIRFAPGREVGNLGLLIAALGLLGELYQFLTPVLG